MMNELPPVGPGAIAQAGQIEPDRGYSPLCQSSRKSHINSMRSDAMNHASIEKHQPDSRRNLI
jgi:hypothetical protein